jgi:hypothetical protein
MWELRIDDPPDASSWPAPPIAWLPSFEPRRSRLMSWPVRLAELADRLAARTLPAPHQDRVRDRGLAHATLTGLDCCCRLVPSHQASLWAERALVRIRRITDQRADSHRRFQVMRQVARQAATSDQEEITGRLHLNPAHCWARCDISPPSGPGTTNPGTVLFFLDDDQLRGLQMQLEGQVLINELADYQPCTVDQWARLSPLVDANQLQDLVRYLETIGLVAWG